ncbi:MAG: NAD kinase, partial [Sediminibacterium sp.]|nr:NAD kinase [Sediminibacterium sp.]
LQVTSIEQNEEIGLMDYLISVGGDGTILDCVAIVKNSQVPIIGINSGRLGFLAPFGFENTPEIISLILNHSAEYEKRTLIHLDSNIPLFQEAPFALNECVIYKQDLTSTIKIHTYLNGEFMNTFWADGLIISTPTGSSAYNLSCGGPIVFPENNCLIVTPISPHNLNVRPIILPDSEILSFEVESRSHQFVCSLDTRKEVVPISTQIAIKRESFSINIVRTQSYDFLYTLRNKLSWGFDKRN